VPGSSDHGDGSSLDILTKCDKCKKDCRKEDNPDPTCATKEWNFLKTHAPQFHFYNDIEASPGHFVYRTTSGSKRGSESGTKYNSFSEHSPPTEADLELLGLEEGFTESQLNGAWKKASLKYHPDKAGKSEEEQRMATEKMQEVNAAKVRLEPKAKHN